MTDEDYVAELRSHGMLSTNQAADRIEALTAERDHAWAMVANADTQMGQSLADYLQAKADNTRLREALDNLLEALTAEDQFRDRVIRITGLKPNLQWLLEAEDDARAALKGETP